VAIVVKNRPWDLNSLSVVQGRFYRWEDWGSHGMLVFRSSLFGNWSLVEVERRGFDDLCRIAVRLGVWHLSIGSAGHEVVMLLLPDFDISSARV
jgi:hypothetical protein